MDRFSWRRLCRGNTPANLIEYCRENGILVEAYSPVAHGEILKSEEIRAIAEKYQVTVPQLCIRLEISYIVAGAETLDYEMAMEKLKSCSVLKRLCWAAVF